MSYSSNSSNICFKFVYNNSQYITALLKLLLECWDFPCKSLDILGQPNYDYVSNELSSEYPFRNSYNGSLIHVYRRKLHC